MKIYSKIRDYYDSVRPFMYEDSDGHIFIRKNSFKSYPDPLLQFDGMIYSEEYSRDIGRRRCIRMGIRIIGFCGRLFVPISYNGNYFYSFESFTTFLEKEDPDLFKVITRAPEKSHMSRNKLFKQYASMVSDVFETMSAAYNIFQQENVPYFVMYRDGYHATTVEMNPVLAEYQFYKVFSPALAFQEIDMFFNSVLVSEKSPPVQITDNTVKLESKGFDKRISFRHRK